MRPVWLAVRGLLVPRVADVVNGRKHGTFAARVTSITIILYPERRRPALPAKLFPEPAPAREAVTPPCQRD
jgi:hypothetical protein